MHSAYRLAQPAAIDAKDKKDEFAPIPMTLSIPVCKTKVDRPQLRKGGWIYVMFINIDMERFAVWIIMIDVALPSYINVAKPYFLCSDLPEFFFSSDILLVFIL